MKRPGQRSGFTLLELMISLAVVSVLIVILLPVLVSARNTNRRAMCAGNQRLLGQAWAACIDANGGRFPQVYPQPSWHYGGVRFSVVDGSPFLDSDRPLNRYLPVSGTAAGAALYECPADRGITGEHGEVGTGRRSAFDAFGTSYRANSMLVGQGPDGGLSRESITTAASRLVVMGDPLWYEVYESTGRRAAWHGVPNAGNMLFLDGSVRFVAITPKPRVGPAVFDPLAPGLAFPLE
jgi:prepilin-type N-terminal cleavage/methylation domain-containing protein/prepilin-type processing-associated H-X9-DG protein